MIRLAFGLVLLVFAGCQPQAQDVKETRFLLGTLVEFTVYTQQEDKALEAIAEAAKVMQGVEETFTTFGDTENSVKRFNRAKVGQIVQLDAEVEQLLLQSIHINQQTQGAFDPTLGALNQLWGFSGDTLKKQPPSKQSIQQALQQSGVKNIQQVSGGWMKKVHGLQLDFGAIAKGYAIDKAIETLKKKGFSQAIVNAGGDMRILGSHGEKPWRIAVRHPRQAEVLNWLEISKDTSIVTSGDYERFYMYEGKRYHHIFDPKTGMPAQASQSVTVVANTATQADALSTALFILGDEKGLDWVNNTSDIAALWFVQSQPMATSLSMKPLLHNRDMAHKNN